MVLCLCAYPAVGWEEEQEPSSRARRAAWHSAELGPALPFETWDWSWLLDVANPSPYQQLAAGA